MNETNLNTDLDSPIFGAKEIGRAACIFKRDKKTGELVTDENGRPEVDERKTFHLLETGAISARHVVGKKKNKNGEKPERGQWCTTLRHIRSSLIPEAAA
jgi:hypothetical protein